MPTLDQHRSRVIEMQAWLHQLNYGQIKNMTKLAGDASFRCYYRVVSEQGSFVVMDAPPEKENCLRFVNIANLFNQAGICVPQIYQQNLQQGFLLLSDLGDQLYLSELNFATAHSLYERAFRVLRTLQRIKKSEFALPVYSETLLLKEIQLFRTWYLIKYKQINLSVREGSQLQKIGALLIANALSQPRVCVHRDYHSRNLLVYQKDQVGVLDFQDAVYGPVTYDLVSLLRDCYIEWPQAKIDQWVAAYCSQLYADKLLSNTSLEEFTRWFDLMGLQRHLKCLGIFVRLHLRDNKSDYLQNIPRVLRYIKRVATKYPELKALLSWL